VSLPLSPQVFAIISRLIEDGTGLHYDPRDADLLADRLSTRATELELDSLLDYYYYLRYGADGPRELDALVELLVVNETYFFREAEQLRALVDLLLPAIVAKRGRARVWCAACSTGEEPLTLTLLLRERGLLPQVDLVATDISTRVLAKAAAGVYGGRSLRAVDENNRRRYFEERGDGVVRVPEELVRAVRWQKLNLLDAAAVAALGTFDVILCRNALIYFADETVVRLVHRFAQSLLPSGLLLVGASESLLRFATPFDCEEHGGAFFYRKAGA
jgi:chemotaxis protein methyltransferase CheR